MIGKLKINQLGREESSSGFTLPPGETRGFVLDKEEEFPRQLGFSSRKRFFREQPEFRFLQVSSIKNDLE